MKAIVAAGHPAVTAAACEVLEAGGNAFDAVVAAGFASTVAEPALTSLGGGGFLLAYPAGGEPVLFDFFVDTPGRGRTPPPRRDFVEVAVRFAASTQTFRVGRGSVAVPVTLAGLIHVHRRLGRLELGRILGPAVRLAAGGLPLSARQAHFLELLEPIMTREEAGRRLAAPGGRYLRQGEVYRNPDLAGFLEELGRRGDASRFYRGDLARTIERDMAEGGLLTAADLAAYRVRERRPLRVPFRDTIVLTNPPPAFGGGLLGLSLTLLDELAPAPRFGSIEHLRALAAVMAAVDEMRDQGWRAEGPQVRVPIAARAKVRRTAAGGTTHVSIADAEGNVASMTTSNGEGSGYVVPGTGIMLNNMLGEDDLHPEGFDVVLPGRRVASMMSPSLVLARGRALLVAGSGGSKRIRTALLQVIANVVDFRLPPQEAVDAPRIHWDGACLQVEPGFEPSVLERLRCGWPVNLWPRKDVYFGGAHIVCPDRGGGGDPRRGGHVRVAA